jgi:thiamine-monophosphate kinase
MNEFELINRITEILGATTRGDGVLIGPGDDAAVVTIPEGYDLVITTDTLVVGRHFPVNASGELVGYRSIGVNLSDLAAMGAEAKYCLVSLTMPEVDELWVDAFARGILRAASRFRVAIVGGNLSRGPLSISVAAHGIVPSRGALLRSGAQPGNRIFVSGQLGSGHAALAANEQRFYMVEPRLDLGVALRGIATSAIDISDGLVADLGHICEASGVGARLLADSLPVAGGIERKQVLSCGDDYELLFTASEKPDVDEPITDIGQIVEGSGVTVVSDASLPSNVGTGYRHF